jgi:pyruvate-formate lyase-activating enzyme
MKEMFPHGFCPSPQEEAPVQELPRLLFADQRGVIYEHPTLLALGMSGDQFVLPAQTEWIPLPGMSKLFYMPGCPPVGMDPSSGRQVTLETQWLGRKRVNCSAVAAFLEPGYVRTLLPACRSSQKQYVLPLWAYTAVGFASGTYTAAAFRVEANPHWDPRNFDDRELLPVVEERLGRPDAGPLLRHLAQCALLNHCFAAKNLFLNRWEAPLPLSRRCNARCLGCLSSQPRGSCPSAHRRIRFRPQLDEIVELAVGHLERAQDPIVSFGQGCEGEPLTEARLLAKAIEEIRRRTDMGTVNLNTNGSLPMALGLAVQAGLDSVRISLNSARPELYRAYCRPRGFALEQVEESLEIARKGGLFTMINYLVFPGVTDQEEEWESLRALLSRTGVQFLHLKNLCIDPDLYLRAMPRGTSPPMGMRELCSRIQQEFPQLRLGYFNQPAQRVPDPAVP